MMKSWNRIQWLGKTPLSLGTCNLWHVKIKCNHCCYNLRFPLAAQYHIRLNMWTLQLTHDGALQRSNCMYKASTKDIQIRVNHNKQTLGLFIVDDYTENLRVVRDVELKALLHDAQIFFFFFFFLRTGLTKQKKTQSMAMQ